MNRIIRAFFASFILRVSTVLLVGATALLVPYGGVHAQMRPHPGWVGKFHLAPQAKLRQMGNPYCGGYNPPPPNNPPNNPPNPGGGIVIAAATIGSTTISRSGASVTGSIPSQAMNQGLPSGYFGMPYGRVGCLAVWTDSNYYQGVGTPVYACYTVPGAWMTEVDLYHFSSGYGFNSYYGYDDGTGGCGYLGPTGIDSGWRALTIHVWSPWGQEYTATSYYYVNLY